MKCLYCENEILDDDEFCGMCGKKQNINMCTNCGAKFMVGNAFCTKCGYKVYSKIDELKKSNNKTIIKIIKAIFSVFRYIVSFFILLFAFIYIFSIKSIGEFFIWLFIVLFGVSFIPKVYKIKCIKNKDIGTRISFQIGFPVFLFIMVIITIIIGAPSSTELQEEKSDEKIIVELNINSDKENKDELKEETISEEKEINENIKTEDNASKEKIDESTKETEKEERINFSLEYGATSQYAVTDVFDGKPYIRYYIPSGQYKVTALAKRSGMFIESKKIITNSDGYNEPEYTIKKVDLVNIGDVDTITITDDVCVFLIINSNIGFTQL